MSEICFGKYVLGSLHGSGFFFLSELEQNASGQVSVFRFCLINVWYGGPTASCDITCHALTCQLLIPITVDTRACNQLEQI